MIHCPYRWCDFAHPSGVMLTEHLARYHGSTEDYSIYKRARYLRDHPQEVARQTLLRQRQFGRKVA